MHGIQSAIESNRPARQLLRRIRNRKVPQALIFSGIDGIGRYQVALRFAMTLNCSKSATMTTQIMGPDLSHSTNESIFPACGTCASCKKIHAGQHPDVIIIKPAGRAIKIEQIRSLRQTLSLKPYEASRRVAIIVAAPLMTLPASNALLKMLEEPPEQTTLILIANKPSDLIATIVSRCQDIRFAPAADTSISKALMDEKETGVTQAGIAASLSQGSMEIAQGMLSHQWQRQRDWILHEIIALGRQTDVDNGHSSRRSLALAELLAADRALLDRVLIMIKSWFRDLAIWPYMPEKIIHQDLTNLIDELASIVEPDFFMTGFAETERIEKETQTNANLRLALETYFTGLAEKLAFAGGSG